MGVMRVFTGTVNPGDTVSWWGWVGYPNANPDVFLVWSVRPVYPPGHAGHPSHQVQMLSVRVEKDPGNQSGFKYTGEFKSTGTHFTEYEMLAQYTEM